MRRASERTGGIGEDMAMAVTAKGATRGAIIALVLLAAGLPSASDAAASSRICRDLEGQLARAGNTGGSPARARQYEKAIADQLRQIDRAEGQLRGAGCSGIFGGNTGQACQSLRSTLQRMNANLASLQRKSRQVSGGRDGSASRARILASLDANDCRGATAAPRDGGARARGAPSFLDRLFGGGLEERRPDRIVREPADENRERQRVVIRNGSRIEIRPRFSGTFRTLCVRACDGYFFPVAYSTFADELDRDAAACQAQCPGTEVELYIHRTPGEEADQMVSLSGVPYTALPTAFRYRQTGFVRPESCGCGAPKSFSIIAGDHAAPADPASATDPAGEPPAETAMVPLPRRRPDPATDPESLANRDGGLDRAAILAIVEAMTPDPAPTASTEERSTASTAERRIRVVGPAFLLDQEAAGGLQAPAPGLVR
ncbi:DUF2865 domain-containing protein [Aquibium sp. ELW1220]|uniref:DUF2865 domain-containing protein n=1 Tax=Aquibium sp. ELW1220 TaxID=2976766 RepID=UPI0025AF9D21|nr:DUF2865 domain-containing protein [Aquibium sp. ELW1220]MDN2581261.1 DUF2865 domain-containing protein [Aquibium sp. ELW1220]